MKLRGKSYDQFFSTCSPVTRNQFWGLVLLGASLIMCGLGLLATVLSRFSFQSMDGLEVVALLFPFAICGAIIYFGVLHIKRAFAGKHSG